MSFMVWCEITCIKCSATICGTHTATNVPRRFLANQAIKVQAVRVKTEGHAIEWVCRGCQPWLNNEDAENA